MDLGRRLKADWVKPVSYISFSTVPARYKLGKDLFFDGEICED